MTSLEMEFSKASPPPSGSDLTPSASAGGQRYRVEHEERSEVNCDQGDSGQSDDDERGDRSPWAENKGVSYPLPTQQGPVLSDLEEDDEEEEGEGQRSSFGGHQPEPPRDTFGSVRHPKFPPVNNGHYQPPQHLNFGENASSLALNYKQAGRRMRSFLEQQFHFLPSAGHSDPILNNNNNYKEPTVKGLLAASSPRSRERSNDPGRSTDHRLPHQSHFSDPPYFLPRDTARATHSPHPSPLASSRESKDPKPDSGGSGLNLLSRSLGTALLNLASLGNLPSAFGSAAGQGGPLNLSNGGGAGPTVPHQYASHQQRSSPSPPFTNTNNFPQLILASGQIVQGIQGAQVLIPSPQGLLTQTVLTIPITQPLSPPETATPTPSPSNAAPPKRNQAPRPPPPEHKDPPSQHQHIPLISQKLIGLDRNLNVRSGLVNRRRRQSQSQNNNGFQPIRSAGHETSGSSPLISAGLTSSQAESLSSHVTGHGHYPHGNLGPPPSKISPTMSHHSRGHDLDEEEEDMEEDFLDRCSDNDEDTMMDGINLDEIKEFAKAFKLRRLSLGLTQTQVGQALSVTEGPAYSQSAICSALAWQLTQAQSQSNPIHQSPSMFEKLDITPKSAQKIKPVLEKWMKEAEDRYRSGNQNLNEFVGMEPSKKRKRRTSFTPQALEILNTHFERNTHPSGAEITTLAHQLGYEREVIRIWFCNKRQALKNTVRMMSKSGSPADPNNF